MSDKKSFIPLVSADQLISYIEYIESFERGLLPGIYASNLPEAIKQHKNGYVPRGVALELFSLITEELSSNAIDKMLVHVAKVNAKKLLSKRSIKGTLKDVLAKLCKSLAMDSTDTEFRLERLGEEFWLHRVRENEDSKIGGRVTLLIMINLVRQLVSSTWLPRKATSIYANGEPLKACYPASSIYYFYNQKHTGIFIPESMMNLQVVARGEFETEIGYDYAIEELKTFRYSLKAVLKPYLSTSIPTLQQAAKYANLSERTLQRRLSNEQISFTDVLNEAIDEIACEMLMSSNTTITQISSNLGYSSASHFTRSFSKKFFITPSKFRLKYRPSVSE